VGRRCRASTIKDVAKELNLDWHTVKEFDKHYMHEQLRRVGTPGPKIIGIDELSIKKRHQYRIVVSDLIRERPLRFGGTDRSEVSMDEFYRFLGEKPAKRIRLAVMGMWRPFRNSTERNAPQAAILFDKFHIIKHLGEALDKARALAQELGCELFEVASEDSDGDPVQGESRLRAFRAAQCFFSRRRAIILFDEVEDVFNDGDGSFGGQSTAQKRKAWMNRTLEENAVPTLWL
jgi:hypothetical protein